MAEQIEKKNNKLFKFQSENVSIYKAAHRI